MAAMAVDENDTRMSNRWCFTLNNPGETRPLFNPRLMNYMIWQLERGEHGTPHIQGYVRFQARKRLQTAKAALGEDFAGAHFERARGSEKENHDYCSKEDTRVDNDPNNHGEEGEYEPDKGKQGHRSDLEGIAKAIIANPHAPLRELAIAHPADFIRYGTGILNYQQMIAPDQPPERPVQNIWIWGPTRSGKSHLVTYLTLGDCYIIRGSPGAHPWDGYTGQSSLLLDEWEDSFFPITTMNSICDKWTIQQLPARYRNKSNNCWTRVFIVSNSNPVEAYTTGITRASDPLLQAFRARFSATTYDSGCYYKEFRGAPVRNKEEAEVGFRVLTATGRNPQF